MNEEEESTTLLFQSSLPWEVIGSYLQLNDVLNLRLTSTSLTRTLSETISPSTCARYLAGILHPQHFYVCSDTRQWKTTSSNDSELLEQLFINKKNTSSSFPLDQLLKICRLLQNIPQQAAIGYNGKYGRYILPMNPKNGEPKKFSKCTRQNCTSCKVVKPPLLGQRDFDTETSLTFRLTVDSFVEITNAQGMPLDLHIFTEGKCIPNLPPDLCCPQCCITDRRTLLLSSMSYQSDTPSANHQQQLPTLTPKLFDDDFDCDESDDDLDEGIHSNDDDDHPSDEDVDDPQAQERTAARRRRQQQQNGANKRQKLSHHHFLDNFPPLYNDHGIPLRQRAIPYDADCKHALALHCTHCHFGILAPATPCFSGNNRFPCYLLGRQLTDKYGTIVGGMLVRSRCSVQDCDSATLCGACQSSNQHAPYGTHPTDNHNETDTVQFSSHCSTCHQSYCTEHAWHSTVCHHW
jgi:hypothetical protein